MASIVTVTAAAASKRLCPVVTVRSHLGVASTEDTAIGVFVDVVSQEVARLYRRDPWRQGLQERCSGAGGHFLSLSNWPIESVSAVSLGVSDPVVVDATTYSIAGPDRGRLYRADGWALSLDSPGLYPAAGPVLAYLVDYFGGWLVPDQVSTWSAAATVTVGAFVRPTTPNLLRFEATVGGTTGASQPTWPTTVGGIVVDNTVTWTARAATELPEPIRHAVMLAAADMYRGGGDVPVGIKSEASDGARVEYFEASAGRAAAFSRTVMALLEGYA